MKTARLLTGLALSILLTACTADIVSEYSSHQCYYTMDFTYGHTASPLYSALNAPNTFCIISTTEGTSSYKLRAELYGTSVHEEVISQEILTRPYRQLGVGGSLIIGRSSFFDGQLYVFDRQCPNCANENRRYNYPLSFSDAHNVRCSTCKRTYSLLNAGAVSSGDGGEKLFRYHATYAGQRLTISNPQ